LADAESDCEDSDYTSLPLRRVKAGSSRSRSSSSRRNGSSVRHQQLLADASTTVSKAKAAMDSSSKAAASKAAAVSKRNSADSGGGNGSMLAAGGDSMTGSLEDLVNSFDDKLTQCFKDYQEQVEKIAPVQVRSQEEIMNECQVWWTITGNFGNMMPIDWSKSTARAKQLSTLNLNSGGGGSAPGGNGGSSHQQQQQQQQSVTSSGATKTRSAHLSGGRNNDVMGPGDDLEDEDDLVAADLDMHSLILTSNPQDSSDPVKSADEVIKEIDEIIDAADEDDDDDDDEAIGGVGGDEASGNLHGGGGGGSGSSLAQTYLASVGCGLPLSSRRVLSGALRGRQLEDLSINELTAILTDIEMLVRELSEELVHDLGVRDELEYEKELKNTFISLLLSIQSRRRATSGSQSNPDGGGHSRASRSSRSQQQQQQQQQGIQYKYLTTVIPYQPEKGAPSLQGLQVLVKILKAINEDSPAVPALLTDYILKVLCPS